MYVVSIDAKRNEVVIGTEKELYQNELNVLTLHFINPVRFSLNCSAKIRYNMEEADCVVSKIPKGKGKFSFNVRFEKPQRAITSGQSIVFYKKDTVLGGGIIFN
jgi:tRNA-specific 2-thiouridylase